MAVSSTKGNFWLPCDRPPKPDQVAELTLLPPGDGQPFLAILGLEGDMEGLFTPFSPLEPLARGLFMPLPEGILVVFVVIFVL